MQVTSAHVQHSRTTRSCASSDKNAFVGYSRDYSGIYTVTGVFILGVIVSGPHLKCFENKLIN